VRYESDAKHALDERKPLFGVEAAELELKTVSGKTHFLVCHLLYSSNAVLE
jgi:hypothetical protein